MTTYATVAELPDGCRQATYDLALALADSKHVLGLRYGEWLGAPALESAIAASAMAQDEFGHARLFYHVVDEFVKGGLPAREEVPAAYRNLEVLDRPFPGWTDFIAANALVDSALLVQLEALKSSSFLPLRKLVPKLAQEERFHLQHARGWLLQLARGGARVKAELGRSLKNIWAPTLRWFGRPGSEPERALVGAGVQDADSEALRSRWIEQLGPLFERARLDLPLLQDAVTGGWILGTELSWEGFDPAFRRRSTSGPDAETFAQIECTLRHDYPVGTR